MIIAEKPLILAMTSGTSGASAMLLSTKDTNSEFFLQVNLLPVHDDDDDDDFSFQAKTNTYLCVSIRE